MKRKTLTDRTLKALKPAPAGARYTVWDSALPNFGVRVSAGGKKTFIVMRRLNGRLLRRTVGQYPLSPLAEAREAARAALRDIADGKDPRTEEKRRRQDTFQAVAEDFIKCHVRNLRSSRDTTAGIRRELIARWGPRPLSSITRKDVLGLLEELVDDGRRHTAHNTLARARKLFAWAIARDLLTASPCDRIKPRDIIGTLQPRQRVLQDDELRAIWQAAEIIGYPFGPFVQLLLLSGQRLREVAEMSWAEIDLEKRIWVIPSDRMKGDAAHEVPLSTPAIELLKSLPRWSGPLVFSTTGGTRPISGFSKAKSRVDNVLGSDVAPWRFHDLRRTMRTALSGLPEYFQPRRGTCHRARTTRPAQDLRSAQLSRRKAPCPRPLGFPADGNRRRAAGEQCRSPRGGGGFVTDNVPQWVPAGVRRIASALPIGPGIKSRILIDAGMKRVWPVLLKAKNPTLDGVHPVDRMAHWGVAEDGLPINELATAAFFTVAVRELATSRHVWTAATAAKWIEKLQHAADLCKWAATDPMFNEKAARTMAADFASVAAKLRAGGTYHVDRSSRARGDDELRAKAQTLAVKAEMMFGQPCPGAVAGIIRVGLSLPKGVITRKKIEYWRAN